MDEATTRAVEAAGRRRLEDLKEILAEHADIIKEEGGDLLYPFGNSSSTEGLEYLTGLGGDINATNFLGKNTLFCAARHGRRTALQWLLDHGAQPDYSDKLSNPLFAAIAKGHHKIVKALIDWGIDTSVEYDGKDALDEAKYYGNEEICNLLGVNKSAPPVCIITDIPDLTGKPMNAEKIAYVEKELGISFPAYFQEFLINSFPEKLFFAESADDDSWLWLGPDTSFFHTTRSFIAYNCTDPMQKEKSVMFDDYLVIGTNGGGDSWCLKLDEADKSVYFHDHETSEFSVMAPNLDTFVAGLLEE
jgi:hypothetical protein